MDAARARSSRARHLFLLVLSSPSLAHVTLCRSYLHCFFTPTLSPSMLMYHSCVPAIGLSSTRTNSAWRYGRSTPISGVDGTIPWPQARSPKAFSSIKAPRKPRAQSSSRSAQLDHPQLSVSQNGQIGPSTGGWVHLLAVHELAPATSCGTVKEEIARGSQQTMKIICTGTFLNVQPGGHLQGRCGAQRRGTRAPHPYRPRYNAVVGGN